MLAYIVNQMIETQTKSPLVVGEGSGLLDCELHGIRRILNCCLQRPALQQPTVKQCREDIASTIEMTGLNIITAKIQWLLMITIAVALQTLV